MKKFGFTLAEVLITLGIIGVVAAITTPALFQNTGNATVGPQLAKFVNTVEAASRDIMAENGVSDLSQILSGNNIGITGAGITEFMQMLTKKIAMTNVNREYRLLNPDGSLYSMYRNSYQLKDGSLIVEVFNGRNTGVHLNQNYNGGLLEPLVAIFYDIDGYKGRNIMGREVFVFLLDKSGTVVPVGSAVCTQAYRTDDMPLSGCNMGGHGDLALGCSGRIADNNWVMDY